MKEEKASLISNIEFYQVKLQLNLNNHIFQTIVDFLKEWLQAQKES